MTDAERVPGAGTLFVVATPIGNLGDLSARALETLRTADRVAAEDTRVTRKLLSHFGLHTPLTSCHEHSDPAKLDQLADRLAAGERIALVSDAGVPGVSDPGHGLIARAIARGVPVVPIPGPSAIVAALSASGLPAGRFCFDGFPPRPKADRAAFFARLRGEERTIVLYEAPHRLVATLDELAGALGGERPAVAARELTKRFEEFRRGTLAGLADHYREHAPRGEFTLMVAGASGDDEPAPPAAESLDELLDRLLAAGLSDRDAARQAAVALSISRRDAYARLLARRKE